jgi:hypothetical protein
MSTDAVQQSWIEFVGNLRQALQERVSSIPHMQPAALKDYIEACNDVYWMDRNAHVFANRVEHDRARQPWENE